MLDIFSLLKKGTEFATFVFGKVRDLEGKLTETGTDGATCHYDDKKLIAAIEDVSQKIEDVASSIVAGVSEKIEFDQLQKLGSQVKVLKGALEFGNENMIITALVPLAEQVQYSKLRIAEGKQQWIGPWMIGESIRLAAMQTLASNDRSREFVAREILNFRVHILDNTGEFLIRTMQSPWLQISDFIEGRNEKLLDNLEALKHVEAKVKLQAEKITAKPKASAAKAKVAPAPALSPAAGWPFPTSTR
jgi:hypothetical protein